MVDPDVPGLAVALREVDLPVVLPELVRGGHPELRQDVLVLGRRAQEVEVGREPVLFLLVVDRAVGVRVDLRPTQISQESPLYMQRAARTSQPGGSSVSAI